MVRHPLQPFDARNFTPGELARGPFSFDRTELAGARAATGPKSAARALPGRAARAREREVVALDDLVTFLEHPVKEFLRQRVGLSLFAGDDDPSDALPVDLDGLAKWAIGDRLLRDRLAGQRSRPLPAGRVAARRAAPGCAGRRRAGRVLDDVEPLVAVAAPLLVGEAADRDVDVALPDGVHVVGTLGGLHGHGAAARRVLAAGAEAADAGVGPPAGAHRLHRRAVVRHHHRPRHEVRAGQGQSGPGERRPGHGELSRSWSRSTAPACANRCRCPPSPPTPTPPSGAAAPTRRRPSTRRCGSGRPARARSGPTTRTSECGVRRRAGHPHGRRRAGRRAHPVRGARDAAVVALAHGGGRGAAVSAAIGAAVLAPAAFDVCGELPTGTTVLEASAGTGKTFTIAALATRYVAEGHATLPDLMLSRSAGRPPRSCANGSVSGSCRPSGPWPTRPRPARPGDEVARLLADAADPEVAARRARLGQRARPVRRGHDRHHPPVLPADARRARGGGRRRSATRCSSTRSTTWSPRWSTTSTCASTARTPRAALRSPGPRRWCWPGAPWTTGRHGSSRPTPSPAAPRTSATASPSRCALR